MFYPKCPCCKSNNISSIEPSIRTGNHAFGQWLQQQAAANHPHPHLKALSMIGSAAYEIYKRWPGGGEKRCDDCGHTFT